MRFMRFFNNTPMAIATVDRNGVIARSNGLFARLFAEVLRDLNRRRRGRSIGIVIAERDRAALARRIAAAARGESEIVPIDAAFAGEDERLGRIYVTPVEKDARDSEAAIVYASRPPSSAAAAPVRPVAEDGIDRQARRRHRARFQQRAVVDHDGDGLSAQCPQADRSVVPGHHADQAGRQPRGAARASAARVLAPADTAAAGTRSRRDVDRAVDVPAADDRRKRHARRRAQPGPVVGEGRESPDRAGDGQSRGQRPRRHARRRQAHDQDRQRHARGQPRHGIEGHAARPNTSWSP